MKTILFTAILMTATLVSCEKNTTETPRIFQEIVISKTTADIIQSDNEFGLAMFREVVSADPESDNIFVSPTSIALALAMTYNGAAGETKTAMETALRKEGFTAEEINSSYKSLIDALVSVDPKVLLEIANSIWYRESFTVLQEFVTTNQLYYNAQVSSLDFNDAGAPGIINNWVSDKTHDKINKIVEEISGQTVMYLINAIYFKGIWQTEFKKENTSDGSFYLNSGSPVTLPVMKQTTALRYTSNEVFSMAELPYGQGNYSMLVMLPQNGISADDIVDILTPENWDTWMGELAERNIDLELPKFTFEYKNELNNELEAMGMGIAFSDGLADFSKINGTGQLFISKVLHKSFVEVNEEGTEAAAVTSVEIELTSVGPEPQVTEFHVDRPFLFAIRETSTGTILFIGRVNNPLTKTNG
ncbi:MAG: serpin family protein [Bacteroidales bacterium]|nr:serpin family protein [Bacteroidales bacterium]